MKAIDLWVLPCEPNDVPILQPWGHHTEPIGHISSVERKYVRVAQLFPEYYLLIESLAEAKRASAMRM